MSAGECSQPSSMNSAIDLLAQPLDVERAARDEMPQPLEPLRRADQAAGAADVDFAFLGDRLAAALGAMVGEDVRLARLVAGQVLDHLRDDVAGALDADAVADAQAQPLDLVAVVERDVGDDHAADADRFQPPDRGQLAGAADLDVDRFERGLGLLGGEFVREPPARRAADLAEPLLPVEPVDLVDHAVDVERQVGPRLLDRAIMGEHVLERVAADEQVADRKAEALDPLHRHRTASSPSGSLTSPQPCARKRSGRAAVMPGPSAAASRRRRCAGWRRSCRPLASCRSFSAAKSAFDM